MSYLWHYQGGSCRKDTSYYDEYIAIHCELNKQT